MKYFAFLLLMVLLSCKSTDFRTKIIASKIDSLTTVTHVKNYITTIDSNYINFYPCPIENIKASPYIITDSIMKALAKKLKINKPYYKTDLDNNGYTDMLVYGGWYESLHYSSYVLIMNFGNKMPEITPITPSNLFALPQIILEKGEPFINLYSGETHDNAIESLDIISTKLIYKFKNLIEYNEHPIDNRIEKVEFKTGGCYGTCPIYEIIINKDRSSTFLAKGYNFDPIYSHDEGFFKGKINEDDYTNLINSLNYINFKTLKDEYAVPWTDDSTGTIKITYENGKVKTISDYGMVGTYGLKSVYSLLADMRFNQKWDKVPDNTRK